MDERIKGSILEQEPPPVSDFVNRVRFCAKALAYGAANDLWLPNYRVQVDGGWVLYGANINDYLERFMAYFNHQNNKNMKSIWKGQYPKVQFLQAFEYVSPLSNIDYLLTPKAFELLETPLTPPKIFISYRRGVSTVLGLLIESRLKALSSDLHPFIDKELEVGEPWEGQLKQKIETCDTFISLIGNKNSFSENVMNEIRWAKDAGKRVISIWHGDYTSVESNDCPDAGLAKFLGNNHGIAVKGSQAIDYEMAITLLENELHYF